jgi:HAD superfamily hydrolase (TIGR01509 family)
VAGGPFIPGYDRAVLRAIVFDFNGVLVDDEPIHLRAFQRVLAEEGVEPREEEYYAGHVGLDDRGCLAAVLGRAGLPADAARLARLIARKAVYYQEAVHRAGYPFFPGAVELVRQAAAEAAMLAIVSGALREEVESALRQAGLRPLFKSLTAAQDVREGKPDPEGYRRALEELNVLPPLPERLLHPHEVLAIENTDAGLRAARAAGLVTLGVAHTSPPARLDRADWVVPRLEGLRLSALQRRFAEVSRS